MAGCSTCRVCMHQQCSCTPAVLGATAGARTRLRVWKAQCSAASSPPASCWLPTNVAGCTLGALGAASASSSSSSSSYSSMAAARSSSTSADKDNKVVMNRVCAWSLMAGCPKVVGWSSQQCDEVTIQAVLHLRNMLSTLQPASEEARHTRYTISGAFQQQTRRRVSSAAWMCCRHTQLVASL